jgi:multiple antibiotic resistance protein
MEALSFTTIFEIALPLFLIMDPVGNAVICVALLREFPPARQRRIILRELVIALLIALIFTYLGEFLLSLLDIRPSALRIAGGVILLIISLKMVYPLKEDHPDEVDRDPFIVPIAVPFIAGPSLLAAVMLYAHREGGGPTVPLAVLLAWTATAVIMLFAPNLKRSLGPRGLRAAERLMGLILIFLSIQMMEDGVRMFLASLGEG